MVYPRFIVRRQVGDGADTFDVEFWENPEEPTGTLTQPTLMDAAAVVLGLHEELRGISTRRAMATTTSAAPH